PRKTNPVANEKVEAIESDKKLYKGLSETAKRSENRSPQENSTKLVEQRQLGKAPLTAAKILRLSSKTAPGESPDARNKAKTTDKDAAGGSLFLGAVLIGLGVWGATAAWYGCASVAFCLGGFLLALSVFYAWNSPWWSVAATTVFMGIPA